MSLADRIKSARERKNITLKELGNRIGKTEGTVQRYESGNIKNPTGPIIEKMAEVLDVNPAYLMGWIDIDPRDTASIPIIGYISCGDPIDAQENVEGYKDRPIDNLPSGELFYLNAQGDSMAPVITDGSLVLCRKQFDVENGEIAAVLVNGDTEATLKKVRKLEGMTLLEPINDAYDPYIINENNPGRIVGKAIEVTTGL